MTNTVVSMGKICIDLIYSGIERLPQPGEEIFSQSFSLQLGGGPPATIASLHRLAVPCKVGVFSGGGRFSQFAEEELQKSGVNFVNLYQGDEPEPLIITSVISMKNDRSFISYQPQEEGTSPFPATEAQVYELYKGCRVAYITMGYEDVWKRLKKEGSILVMDSFWDDHLQLDWYKEIFPYIDYFTPNEKEAPKITGADSPEEALDILAEYLPNPIVKLSSNGCILKEGKKTVHVPAMSSFKHVDSTGAGDAFLAGFLYGIYHGYTPKEAVIFGNITGGNCVTEIGCLTAEINEEQMQEYYQAYLQQ